MMTGRLSTILTFVALLLGPVASGEAVPKEIEQYFRAPPEFAGDLGTYRSPLRFADGAAVKTAADWQRRR